MEELGAAAALGALAGGRTFAIPSLLSRKLGAAGDGAVAGPVTRALAAPEVARVLTGLAAAELAADKLPAIGPRTEPIALLGRMVAGAAAGAAAAELLGKRQWLPAVVGAAAAFACAHVAYRLRRGLRRRADVPDAVIALAEDALVLGVGGKLAGELVGGSTGGALGTSRGSAASELAPASGPRPRRLRFGLRSGTFARA